MRERNFTRSLYAVAAAATALFLVYAYTHPVRAAATAATAKASTTHRAAAGASSTSSSASASSRSATATAGATSVVSVSSLLDPTKKYLGIAQDNVPSSTSALTALTKEIGKQPNIIAYYVPWGQALDQTWILELANDGILPLIQFEPASPSIASIAAGATDSYATTLAETIKNLDVPIVISFGHEMNGNWFNWGTKGTSAADFVKAWRRIHDIFTKAGATDVIWLWDVNVTYPVPDIALEPLYPGDAYVDWVGLTGYYNITAGGRSSFDTLFEPTMQDVRTFTQKPFLIAETGVSPSSEKPTEIENLFTAVEDHSDVLGFVWFNYDKQGENEANWMINSDATSESTFARLAQGSDWGFTITP
jgi:mannan endo-1,4-beta-mannosidase